MRSCRWISIGLVFTVAFLTYWNSLDGGFVFDDHRGILTNEDLDPSKTSVWELFTHDFWGGHMSRAESHKSYRPLTVLSFRYFNFYFSELRPDSYHLVNILMHCTASVLFLLVTEVILGRSYWPTFAALLFAVHSIHTEVVANTVGRAEVLSCIFFLAALLTYFKAISVGSGRSLSSIPRTKWTSVVVTVVLSTCSMLSKEQGITAIGVCVAFDVLLHWEVLWEVIFQKKSFADGGASGTAKGTLQPNGNGKARRRLDDDEKKELPSIQGITKRIGLLAISGAVLLWFRVSMNDGTDPVFKPEEMRAAFHPERTVRILSFSNIYALNAWLLLAPSALCCDWSLGSVPLVTSFSDTKNVWSLLLYAGLLALVIRVLQSKRDYLEVGMGLALVVLPFFPASGIILKVGFVIAERVLYMPSLGYCLLVTTGMKRLSSAVNFQIWKQIVYAVMAYLLIVMAAKSFRRNQDWASDLSLFESGVQVNPNNVKIRNNLGMELKNAGRVNEARAQYEKSIEIDPDYGEVYFNYGNLLSDAGDFEAAAASFEKAILYPQMYAKTLNNLATMYFRLGRWKEAEEKFKESLQLTPDQATTYNNLASLYGENKRFQESEEMFRKALELNPTYTEAYFNLGTLLIQMGRVGEAEDHLNHALKLNPNHHGATNNLKVIKYHKHKAQRQ